MLSRKLLAPFLIISFLITTPAVSQAKVSVQTKQLNYNGSSNIHAQSFDKRAEILRDYLAHRNSPMQYQAQSFIEAADKYNLDWKLVPAIAGVESTFGKFIPGGYNAWGWGVYGTQAIYFDSWRDGIFTVSKGLRQNYFNKGLTDPYVINRVYAASPTWGSKVTYFLNDLDAFEQKHQKQTPAYVAANFNFKVAGSSAIPIIKFE